MHLNFDHPSAKGGLVVKNISDRINCSLDDGSLLVFY